MNIEITPQEELPDADYEVCIFCQCGTIYWHEPTNRPVCPPCSVMYTADQIGEAPYNYGVPEEEIKPRCKSCWHTITEYLTPQWDGDDGPAIHGLDYRYRCKFTNEIVDRNHWCNRFELPF